MSGADKAVTALSECVLALCSLAIMLNDGPCWCQVAIGNPMMREHSASCLRCKRAVEGIAKEGGAVLSEARES